MLRDAVIGSIIVTLILVISTILTGKVASGDTEEVVHTVSQFYLDEMTERREQIVSSMLEKYIGDMDAAIGLIEPDALKNVSQLRAYQEK